MPWLLNLFYLLAVTALLPWLLHQRWSRGKYRRGVSAKLLGRVPRREGDAPCAWFHGASLGEINLLATVAPQFEAEHPGWQCVISTNTSSGFALAREKFPNHPVFFAPLDFTWAVREAMARIRPSLLVFAEPDVLPNWIQAARAAGARTAVINGRTTQRLNWAGRWFAAFLRPAFAALDLVCVQSEDYVEDFVRLGTPRERIVVTGSIKFDGAQANRLNFRTQQLARRAGVRVSDVVFLAGSTQDGEEPVVLDAFRALADEFPRLRLILVPRHQARFAAVARLLDESGLAWQRRTRLESEAPDPAARVLLVDTIGELGSWWGCASIAFVGGSLGKRGGQSMIEPAAYGAAVSFGPNTRNFRDAVTLLLEADAAHVVRDGAELTAFVRRCLAEPAWAEAMGERAAELVARQRGATAATLAQLAALVEAAETSRPTPQPTGSLAS